MPARSLSSSLPAWPTNGMPCLSSWKPGASPTNIRSAVGLPAPKTTWVRPCASRQRVHPEPSSAYARSAADMRRKSTTRDGRLVPAAAGAAAAASAAAAEARLRRGPMRREDAELLPHVGGAAVRAGDPLLVVPDEL